MTPRSRSRSIPPRRSYSKSPGRQNGRRNFSKSYFYDSRSRSKSHHRPTVSTGVAPLIRSHSNSSTESIMPRHRRRSQRSQTRSRSPNYRYASRTKPIQCRCIGVFGLSVHTTQQKIRDIFARFGPIERIQVVIDAQTGRSRGFCFIYYEDINDAKAAKDACSGMEVDERRIRVDYSITQRPHTPTPGVYMGRPTRLHRDRRDQDRYRDEYHSRSRASSPYSRSVYRSDRHRRYDSDRRSCTPRRMK